MVIAGYIIRVRAKTDMLDPVFAVRYLNLPELKEHLRKICRGAVNQANINSKRDGFHTIHSAAHQSAKSIRIKD